MRSDTLVSVAIGSNISPSSEASSRVVIGGGALLSSIDNDGAC